MIRKHWDVMLGDTLYCFEVHYSKLWGNTTFYVNGNHIEFHHPIPHPLFANVEGYALDSIEDRLVMLFIYPKGYPVDYDLVVDGYSVNTGEPLFANVPEHYKALGIPVYTTDEQIQQTYTTWVEQYNAHYPQSTPEVQAHLAPLYQRKSTAFAVLGDPQKRAHYDTAQHLPARPQKRNISWYSLLVMILGAILALVASVAMVLAFVFG